MVSQVRPKDATDQSQGLRQRNTDVFWMVWDLNLRAPNYQISAPFVDYTVPEWEGTFAFWRAWFDSAMEKEIRLGWNVQLCAKLCPLPFPLKLEFGNCSMFAALIILIKYSRSQTRHLLNELWKSTRGLEEFEGCCNGGARLYMQTKSTQSFLFLAKYNVKMYFFFPIPLNSAICHP